MRCLLLVLLGFVAVNAMPLTESDEAALMEHFDTNSYLSPMNDDDGQLSKRILTDEELENLLLLKMEMVFKILGPLAPDAVKNAIRQVVNEQKYEIVQALKTGGGMLLGILIEIWKKAFFGGLLG